jgi:hypothetical protein
MRDFLDEALLSDNGLVAIAQQKLSEMSDAAAAYDAQGGDAPSFAEVMRCCEAMGRVAKAYVQDLNALNVNTEGQGLGTQMQRLAASIWIDTQMNLIAEGGVLPAEVMEARAENLALYQEHVIGEVFLGKDEITQQLQTREPIMLGDKNNTDISHMQQALVQRLSDMDVNISKVKAGIRTL